jgi:hypothetical protein
MSKAKFIFLLFLFTSTIVQYSSISLSGLRRAFKYLFVDNLDSQCVIIHRTKLEKERSGGGGREMFMQIDFIRKSCGGRTRIARKGMEILCFSFFLRSKICVFLFPPFYSFPERIFFLFCCFFTFVQKLLFSPSTQTSAHGLGLVRSKAKAGLKNVDNVLCSTSHTCFLSFEYIFLSLAWKFFSPRAFSGSSQRSHQHIHTLSPHFYGSPQKWYLA